MPDRKIVSEAFKVEVGSMEFRKSDHHNWDRFSKEFVFHVDERQRAVDFVKRIKQAKIEQERKMRHELDLRMLAVRGNDREFQAFGK